MNEPTLNVPPRLVGAPTPAAIHARLEDALNAAALDAFVDTFEPDATMVAPPDGVAVRGHAAIRQALAPIMALHPQAAIQVTGVLEGDELALTHASVEVTATSDAGHHVHIRGRGTIVSRRQPDGTWRIVLDNPMSPG